MQDSQVQTDNSWCLLGFDTYGIIAGAVVVVMV